MSAKVSFTSAGHLGHTLQQQPQQQQQQPQLQQHITIITASTPRASAVASTPALLSAAASPPPSAPCPDWHRQNHSSSKLPSFRFADRRPSTSGGRSRRASNASNASNTSNGNDSAACENDDSDASRPNNVDSDNAPGRKNSVSPSPDALSSAALSQSHPSLAYRAPPSPVSPNPGPRAAPSLPSSADPGPFPGLSEGPSAPFPVQSHLPAAVTGQTLASSGPLDLDAFDTALARPLTPLLTAPTAPICAPTLAHQTTTHHHHVEKHSVSASTAATTPTSAPSTAPSSAALTSTTPLSSVASPPLFPPRSRASSSCQPDSVVDSPIQSRRPASFPDTSPATKNVADPPHSASILARARSRRSLVSRRSNGAASTHPPPSLNHERLQAVEAAQAVQSSTLSSATQSSSDRSSKDSLPGQKELIPLKTLANSSPPDDRRASVSHRPPVSYRPPVNHNAQPSTSTPVRVPPIRAFRSSGSRKSLTLDMNSRSRIFGDDPVDTNHDRTLRALEGRSDQDFLLSAASVSGRRDPPDADDTGDVFLKIAREESSRRRADEKLPDEAQSVVSRATRSSHRRPYSSVVPSSKPTSPPQVRRRLSDQQETSRQRRYDDDRVSEVSRVSTYRSLAREKAASAHPGEESSRTRAGGSTVRASPATPRSMAIQDSDGSTYKRRRGGSISDSNPPPTRSATYRTAAPSKSYNSSPLVRSFELRQQAAETSHGAPEGTESTASTNAPSTMWDELDDLKSRIHRLELTGKLPSTSGAAVSRLSDERPPTATTTVTTMSSSPKRPGNANKASDAVSTTSSTYGGSHPLLNSALVKSKPLLEAEVFRALEAVANDAMALSSMMGTPGQPGPISSGASTIGSQTTVTDRQLRRKADSVCRGLTELCVALGEDRTQTRPQQTQVVQAPPQAPSDAPTTPTVTKTFSGFPSQRRPSFGADQAKPTVMTSPRTMSKFEERRMTLLNGSALPAPRATVSTPATPLEPISRRRSSLLVARTRRAGTEEPEDGRKSSLMLRTRRAGTEEPEEGRRTSLFVRNRRGTVGEDDDEQIFRSPSRVNTDMNPRVTGQELVPVSQVPDNAALGSSALPRRRFASSNLNPSRLATPQTTNVPSARRYLERSNMDRDGGNIPERPAEERAQRHMSLGQSMLSRTSSMIRRPARDSHVSLTQSSAAAGGYR